MTEPEEVTDGLPVGDEAVAKADANMDAFLAKHDADDGRYGEVDGDGYEAPPEPKAKQPKAPESKAAKDEPAEAESDADEDEPSPQGEDDEGVPAADYEKALAAIRRDGIDPDSLRWGRKRLVEHGLKRAAHYAKGENDWRELQEKLKASEERFAQRKESGPATPTDEPFELNGALEPFREELGEESAKALAKALQAMHAKSNARASELEKQLEQAQRLGLMGLYESARGRLSGRFPALADSDTWQTVAHKAEGFMASGHYESIDSAVLDAAKVLDIEDEAVARKQEQEAKADAARRKGVPTGKSRRSAPAAKSGDELERDLLAELEVKYGYTDEDF